MSSIQNHAAPTEETDTNHSGPSHTAEGNATHISDGPQTKPDAQVRPHECTLPFWQGLVALWVNESQVGSQTTDTRRHASQHECALPPCFLRWHPAFALRSAATQAVRARARVLAPWRRAGCAPMAAPRQIFFVAPSLLGMQCLVGGHEAILLPRSFVYDFSFCRAIACSFLSCHEIPCRFLESVVPPHARAVGA